MRKLKFETDDVKFGLTKSTGFAWADNKGVYIEYQVSDNILELYKSKINDVFISYSTIDSIRYKKSWLFSGGTVYIALNTLKKMSNLPFLEDFEVTLDLNRKQRNQGKDFTVNTQLDLQSFRLEALNTI
jgi:hypothetical protein